MAGGGVTGSGTVGVRLELGKDGRVTSATVKQQVQVDGEGNVLPNSTTQDKGSVSLSVEDKLTFPPPGMSVVEAAKDPAKAADMLSRSERESTVTFTGTGSHGNEGRQVEVKMTVKPGEALSPEVFAKAAKGDFGGAVRSAGDKVDVELNI